MNDIKVKIAYKNKDLEVINEKEFDFIEYCELISKKVLGILYKVDNYKNGDIDYNCLKKYIFDIAGSIKRIPENIRGD